MKAGAGRRRSPGVPRADSRRRAASGASAGPLSGGVRRGGPDGRRVRVALRAATADDCRMIWKWRNEETTRGASFDSSEIAYETHEAWFRASLARRDRKIFVVVAEAEPCGVVRLDRSGRRAEVSIFLARARHGVGIGPRALRAIARVGIREHLDALTARTKSGNYPSRAAFRSAGFTEAVEEGGVVTMVKPLRLGRN